MPNTPGRGLFRSPFPIPPSHQTTHEEQGAPGANNRVLADVDTQVHRAIPPTPRLGNTSPLADVETRKNSAFPPVQDKRFFLANVMTQHLPAQRIPPSPLGPASIPNPKARSSKKRRAPLTRRKKVQRLLVAILVLIPSLFIIFEFINFFLIYKQMQDGVAHLQAVGNIFHKNSNSGMESYFDSNNLQQAQIEIDAARSDFTSVSDKLDNDGTVALASNLWPAQINTARSLGHIAATGMDVAQQLLKTVQDIAPSIAPAFQKNSSSDPNAPLVPYLTPSSYQELTTTLSALPPLVHDITKNAQGLSLDSLPLSSNANIGSTASPHA